ncbi:MAG: methylated-DNA--[protein]-cysteine S-methyltransferase [Herbinix sp.]|jgi:methylated-DNA-[protein]-cysteine S-methyltransferase|nr:methylated-DNA--[protein]-cysteine S-methyltransferase [Herbinix sp.]
MKYVYYYETKIGRVVIAEDGHGITDLSITEELHKDENEIQLEETERIKEAAQQFYEYLEGKRKIFQLSLNPAGTPFQKRVWEALVQIPYGETRSYKQVAEAVGNPKACRAVGMANHFNPIMCIIPCHRVIGANKKLVGYAGGLHIKELLLNLEMEGNERYE